MRFPAFSPGRGYSWAVQELADGVWPGSGGVPEGYWVTGPVTAFGAFTSVYPFLLRGSDYSQLTNVMLTSYSNDPLVDARDATCVLIVDEHGLPLDFAAHISQWDPQPACGGCARP